MGEKRFFVASFGDLHGHGPRGDGGGVKEAERERISSD